MHRFSIALAGVCALTGSVGVLGKPIAFAGGYTVMAEYGAGTMEELQLSQTARVRRRSGDSGGEWRCALVRAKPALSDRSWRCASVPTRTAHQLRSLRPRSCRLRVGLRICIRTAGAALTRVAHPVCGQRFR